ncbi:hypothetical protein [Pseudarthrobacter sp. NIBRBAC000502770]|nr:hypothetical protein [Pseudarthrobacter sp. NIBRBAC000502770]
MSVDVHLQVVPLVDLVAQQAEVHDEVMAELASVLSTAAFIEPTRRHKL